MEKKNSLSVAVTVLLVVLLVCLLFKPNPTNYNPPAIMEHIFYTDNATTVRKCSGEQRSKFVQQQCQILSEKYPNDTNFPRKNILDMDARRRLIYVDGLLTDDKHKLLFCVNAKVASSTYLYILAANSDKTRFTKDGKPMIGMGGLHQYFRLSKLYNLTRLSLFSDSEITKRLKSYRKVMVVRDPLLRVFSSYREKVSGVKGQCGPYQRRIESAILKTIRKNFTRDEDVCKYPATYQEFTKYIAKPGNSLIRNDRHWRRQYLSCQPCAVDYDYYIRLETGESDMKYFLDEYMRPETNNSMLGSGVWHNNHGGRIEDTIAKNNYIKFEEQYKQVNPRDFEIIKKFYAMDSFIYGYTQTLDDKGMKSICRASQDGDETQCC